MKKTIVTCVCLLAWSAAAQTPANPPAFEVASIRPAAPQTGNRVMVRMGGDPGRVDYANVSLKDVLARAYKLKRYQISGPAWMDSQRYDITAKVPEGVKADLVPEMLQALLAERFKMKVHRENKEQAVYALGVGKNGPKLKPSEQTADAPPAPGPDGARRMTRARMMFSSDGRMEIRGASMAAFTESLSNLLDRQVVDETGLTGDYDIDLEISMEDLAGMRKLAMGAGHPPGGAPGAENAPAPQSGPAPSIFTAVQQLGLKLDSRKAQVDYLVVDSAEKTPTEN
jgi:uncharacterized protein (TIGR03435 family)